MQTTKRLYLLPQGDGEGYTFGDLSGQLDAPLHSVSSEDLKRLRDFEPDRPFVRTHGDFKPAYAPIKEGVPDIPERPTVLVERTYLAPRTDWLGAIGGILTGIFFVAVAVCIVGLLFGLLGGMAR